MEVYQISAVTLMVKNMEKSCNFYSRIPGFRLVYGGTTADSFSTFEVGKNSDTYLNLELGNDDASSHEDWKQGRDLVRIIFHTEDVDKLYSYLQNDANFSKLVSFENEPIDASWGERFFHIQDPDGYQLSFAKPIRKVQS
jgi:catechol 2,3-dioxygenase-like lactoylglutathione lyase family enzyme